MECPMPRRKSVRSYHHGNLKTALKHAALKLVREKGPRGFSLNEASRLAGVNVAAPYRHFKDKAALLAEIACEGNLLLFKEVQEAAGKPSTVKQRMLEAGLAYLRFSSRHSDYFDVIFNSSIDKAKYPEVHRTGMEAFGVILELAKQYESTAELAEARAVSAWALVHGLAALCADGALSSKNDFAELRPVLERFLDQPYK
jgi:AcrR family transcriptional regulator